MQTLYNELERMKNDLNASMRQLRKNGEILAHKEHDYQVIKAQAVFEMKDEGCSMTEINLAIKGQPKVAEAILERDLAKTMYDANLEHINVVKLELRVIENQISREWNNGTTQNV